MLNEQKYLSESDISTIKSRISGMQHSLTNDEVEELKMLVEHNECEYMIYPEHAQKGIDYLREKCFKRNGQPRKTKQVEAIKKHNKSETGTVNFQTAKGLIKYN